MDRGSELYSQFLAGDDAVLEQLITEYKDGLILYLHTLVGVQRCKFQVSVRCPQIFPEDIPILRQRSI